MRIKLLEWDTQFFNKRIGSLYLDLTPQKELKNLSNLNDFDIVYIFSSEEISIQAPLMDIKVTYSKSIKKTSSINEVIKFNISKHDYNQLLELSYQSGHDSRFLKDPSFGLFQFKRLYKRWIDNSIDDNETLVLIHPNKENIEGFVTVKKNMNYAQIGLIAVKPNSHGKGIGKKLIQAVENQLKDGLKLIVATQETNTGACKFYENLGFRLEKNEYIYHLKNDSI
jgi:dTDP-4-amino-4,6-dideoxy-D-galactose acyltransferase